MIELAPDRIAAETGARIAGTGSEGFPVRAEIDSRRIAGGELFFALPGRESDGGAFAAAAIEAGAWGVVVSGRHEAEAAAASPDAWVFVVPDPLGALQALARAWRLRLPAQVIAITGSVGKTSTKDILQALLPGPTHASRENFNTEIGLPLTILEAEAGTSYLILEMAMRGPGQIAELAGIAVPDLGAITNVGPVHTELLGSLAAIAAAKAELLDGLPDGAAAVVPVDAGALEPEIAAREGRLRFIRFGPGAQVSATAVERRAEGLFATISASRVRAGAAEPDRDPQAESARFELPFTEAHNLSNALAAIALGLEAGVDLETMAGGASRVGFSRFRGECLALPNRVTVVNDCYNANPLSMRAALDHLGEAAPERRLAVLGPMAELGPEAESLHAAAGRHARERGVELLVGVGPEARWYEPDELVADPGEAAELVAPRLEAGDTVLVKGSRSAELELFAERLRELQGDGDG